MKRGPQRRPPHEKKTRKGPSGAPFLLPVIGVFVGAFGPLVSGNGVWRTSSRGVKARPLGAPTLRVGNAGPYDNTFQTSVAPFGRFLFVTLRQIKDVSDSRCRVAAEAATKKAADQVARGVGAFPTGLRRR